jgi:hypothetical protein
MNPQGDDVIFLLRPGTLIHWCQPGHEWPEDFTREQLDPLAQGSCRYCGEPLPTQATVPAKPQNGALTSEE